MIVNYNQVKVSSLCVVSEEICVVNQRKKKVPRAARA